MEEKYKKMMKEIIPEKRMGFKILIKEMEEIKMRINKRRKETIWPCVDCGKNCFLSNKKDYYMVTDRLWKKFGVGKRMLCLKCFKIRLGREFTKKDFTDCEANIELKKNNEKNK